MIQNLSIFQLAGGLARHAAARQAVIARNVANMDTPGFKARDISKFQDHIEHSRHGSGTDSAMKISRSRHIAISEPAHGFRSHVDKFQEQKPNGNSVSIEAETLKAIEAERAHSRALAIYQSSLSILKTSIGRRG